MHLLEEFQRRQRRVELACLKMENRIFARLVESLRARPASRPFPKKRDA